MTAPRESQVTDESRLLGFPLRSLADIRALPALRRVVGASGRLSPEGKQRLARVEAMFDGAEKSASKGEASNV